mgnify:FL=1
MLKWLIISWCVILLCGVFILYIIESIDIFISEQSARESKSDHVVSIPSPMLVQDGLTESNKVETAPESQDMLDLVESNGISTEPIATEPVGPSQWRVIERSESYGDQLQYYSPNNVNLDSRHVIITTNEELMGDKRYTSGMIESANAYLYGNFSFVINVSEGKGLFPAIWLLPAENKALPEIDIFEMIGSASDVFYGVVHYINGSVQTRDFFKTKVENKDTYLIELEWTKDRLRWFIDGECMLETSKFIPDEPMYLIVNQAVGGKWAGSPDETTVFPATFVIESWTIEPERSQKR